MLTQSLHGRFLLTQLHVDFLIQQCTLEDFESGVKTLPKDLSQVYDGALQRIRDQNEKKFGFAIKAMGWLVFAKRPLTIAELQHAVATKPGSVDIKDHTISEEVLITCCAGLVVVDTGMKNPSSGTRTARLAHYTVEKYIEENASKHYKGFQSEMTETCLTYLSFETFSTVIDGKAEFAQRKKRYPLLSYAADHWGHHMSSGVKSKVYQLAAYFLSEPAKVENAFKAMSDTRCAREVGVGPLHVAAYFGLGNLSRKLIEKRRVLNLGTCTSRKETALHWAAFYQHNGPLEVLVERGADLNAMDQAGATALHLSVMNENTDAVQTLLSSGRYVDVNLADGQGWTPLRWAAAYGQLRIVQLLLQHEIDVNARDNDGWTAIRWAAQRGHRKIVDILLQHKASAQSDDGWTLLHWAATEGRTAMIRLLLDRKINSDAINAEGLTPLRGAIEYGHGMVAWLLLQHGAEINRADKEGLTPLHAAVSRRNDAMDESLLWLLLESGADIHARTHQKRTALDIAASKGKSSVVWLLLEKGARPNNKDNADHTALHWAVKESHDTTKDKALVQLLLERGAEIDAETKHGRTALHIAAENGHTSMMKFLIRHRATPIKVDNVGQTALHLAVKGGHEDAVKILLQKETNLVKVKNAEGWTALHEASSSGSLRIMHLLLDHNSDINAPDRQHCTPLHRAAGQQRHEAVDLLLRRGAEVNLTNKKKSTALHEAAATGNHATIKRLLKCPGVVTTLRNVERQTAWEVSQNWGHDLPEF